MLSHLTSTVAGSGPALPYHECFDLIGERERVGLQEFHEVIFTQPTVLFVEEMVSISNNGVLAEVHHFARVREGAVGVLAFPALAGKIGTYLFRKVCGADVTDPHVRLV